MTADQSSKVEGGGQGFLPMFLAVALLPATYWFGNFTHSSDIGVNSLQDPVPSYTREQLALYDGKPEREDASLLLSVWGRVFNVTSGAEFYAPGESYAIFAGHDCSHCLAIYRKKQKFVDAGLDNLTELQVGKLNESFWETYVAQYPVVGVLVDPPYAAAAYDHYAGPFAEVTLTKPADVESDDAAPKKRRSKCPMAKIARAVTETIVSYLPQGLLG